MIKHHRKIDLKQLIFWFFGAVILAILLFYGILFIWGKTHPPAKNIKYGVSFSPTFAKSLGLDWKSTYLSILEDLQVKYLRLPTYWERIEPVRGKINYSDIDFMLDEAARHGAKVTLVLGFKQPRWPECQNPIWVYKLTAEQRQVQTLQFIQEVVERYKNNQVITAWQVENEPFFPFGHGCEEVTPGDLKQETNLVRSIDSTRPIILTDSGELGFWVYPMKYSNIFGTTLYRTVYNPLFGYTSWPLPGSFYNLKSTLVKKLFAPNNEQTIVSELQAEPWLPESPARTDIQEQLKLFPVQEMIKNLQVAKDTGFDEIYLWGAEWWYYMGQSGYPQYLQYAKTIYQ